MALSQSLKLIAKEILFNSPLKKHFFRKFEYNFTVHQLWFLCKCLEETKGIEGSVAEIGCANGSTTVFLNRFLDEERSDKTYFALDTFTGFVAEDVAFEVSERNKKRSYYEAFKVNKKKWFDGTMEENGITRVRSIETDLNKYDLATLEPLSFVLLDVDLYRPMKKALPELYRALSPGGIIVVDDCDKTDVKWHGSDQAYKEFIAEIGQPLRIVHDKLGIVTKQP